MNCVCVVNPPSTVLSVNELPLTLTPLHHPLTKCLVTINLLLSDKCLIIVAECQGAVCVCVPVCVSLSLCVG